MIETQAVMTISHFSDFFSMGKGVHFSDGGGFIFMLGGGMGGGIGFNGGGLKKS